MPQKDQSPNTHAQHKVAQKYRLLGYDVIENPQADHLPDFMHGVNADILARSRFGNVVVEVKERTTLKGSNNMVAIAERVADHPDWRFELVVLQAKREQSKPTAVSVNYNRLMELITFAANGHFPELAYMYLATILVGQARDLAERHNMKAKTKTDRGLFSDLSFEGLIPEALTNQCLSVLATRDEMAHSLGATPNLSDKDLKHLLELCRQLEQLS